MVAVALAKVQVKKGVQSCKPARANADPAVKGRPPAGATIVMVIVCGAPVQVNEVDPVLDTTVGPDLSVSWSSSTNALSPGRQVAVTDTLAAAPWASSVPGD
jgi:hypothetical protein